MEECCMLSRYVMSFIAVSFLVVAGCTPYTRYFSSLKSSDVEVRRDAAFQLTKASCIDKRLAEELFTATADKDPLVREFALKAIGKLPPKTEGVGPVIRICLRDPDISVRRTAASIFSEMNPVPSEILIPLAEALADKDSILYSYVKTTFVDLGPLGVNALVHSCKSKNDDLRCRAASTLGTIGFEAKRALPTLQAMLNDQNDSVRTAAKSSIEKIQLAYNRTSAKKVE